ncbi:uncharacterized protein LOC111875606 isoform X4 [Cryptotermes secundus]|nr:uncharacterized protein LOC111875606 isoform X4 [Cryptotermes secundus]
MSLDVVPLFVHKLAQQCRDVLVTDRFLYVTDINGKNLSVVSCQLSESRIGGESDCNPDSVIETFEMKHPDEKILALYKRGYSDDHHRKPSAGVSSKESLIAENEDFSPQVSSDKKIRSSSREKEKKSSQVPFCLPKSLKELKLDMPSVDTCVIVTTSGVYEVALRLPPAEVFMDLVLTYQAIERAERLAVVFGLNFQQLLEFAGDLKLSAKEFPQAISLYKVSKCRHLKSVLKFAAAGHASELLSYIKLLFSTSGLDLTTSERIHLSNLAVMSHTEQVLRATAGRVVLLKHFLKFLRENLYYDEVLAVNVAGQTGLWEILQFLASFRGLHPEVLDILTKIVRSLGEGLVKVTESTVAASEHLPALDSGLWLCVSDPSLLQSLLSKPQQARIHLQFIRTCLPHLEQFALQRLAALYDPSSPQLRPSLTRMFKMGHRQKHSSESYSSCSAQMDPLDPLDLMDEIFVPGEDIVQTFLLVLLYLAKKRQVSSFVYIPELMEKIQLAKDEDEDSEDLCPSLPIHASTLSAGFSHVALVRNGAIYTWGNAVQGCLGTGPTMSRYSCPQQVSILPTLKLEVISVACGRQHTLSLTNNGVYAWGSSQYGQLGIGKTGQCPYPRMVEHLSRERIIAVSAGQYHSIALADDGRVFTWGWGVHGQLGHHSVEDYYTPTLVEGLIGKVVTQICGGHGHTVALTAEGKVYTFGSSVFGQLGNGSNMKSSVPVHVTALTERITIIATNYFHNLAVSSTNKVYIWGSSPQVLRLQAQAQKRSRHLQQQLLSSVTPLSPSKPVTAQVHSALNKNSEISDPLLESPISGTAAKPDHDAIKIHKDHQESNSTHHSPIDTEYSDLNLKPVLICDSQLPSVDISHSSSSDLFKSQDLSVEASVNKKDSVPSHSELPSSVLNTGSNSTSFIPKSLLKSVKCHKFSTENSSDTSEVSNGRPVNNQKQFRQSGHKLPLPKGGRMCDVQVIQNSDSDECMQKSQSSFLGSDEKQEDSHSSSELNGTSWNKNNLHPSPFLSQDVSRSNAQPSSSSLFSDFENANVDTSSRDLQLPGSSFASRQMDQNLDLKVKPTYPPLTTTTAEGYSIPTLIVSPTMEFKGLTAGPSPPDSNFASPDTKSDNQSARSEPIDNGQSHLTPQLVDTSLVVGRIIQVSCGCHHSALLTRDGVLYMWGRNLDGQLGSGTRKEIPIPTPLTSPAPSATSSTRNSSSSSQSSAIPKSTSSGVINGGEKLRLRQVSCGCEYTVAQESTSAGKIWAWGSNSQAQLGRVPVEESKGLEGKLVMLKTTKRVIKLPHGSQNSSDIPKAVPGLPNSTISFKYDSFSGFGGCCGYSKGAYTELCPPLCSIEEPCYGLRTLHYAFQHFHGYYDSVYLLNKCLILENYQGAAKLAALDRHYHLALAYQLKALALATQEFGFNAEKHPENHCSDLSKETCEKNSNSDRTFTKSSNETASNGVSLDCSNEDKMNSTDFSDNSNVINAAKDRNSNPIIINYKEQFKAHVTNVNSSCVSVQHLGSNSYYGNGSANSKTNVTENAVSNSNLVNEVVSTEVTADISSCTENRAECVEGMGDITANQMRRGSLVSDTADAEENILNCEDQSDMINVPQNSNYKNKIITKSKTGKGSESMTEVENRNQRNSRIDLLRNSENESERNQFVRDDNSPPCDRICIKHNEDLKPNPELPLVQCSTDTMKTESEKEERLKPEDSKQQTNLLAKPLDHLSRKTHVSPIEEEVETSSSVSTPESLIATNVNDSEIHAFAVQGGTEQMSEGHHLTSPDSITSPLVSEEQGLLSPEPFVPHVNEQSSQNASVNLIPINENGNIQNQVISSEVGEENSNKCETELIGSLTSLLNSYTSSTGNSESFIEIKQETALRDSDVNSGFHNGAVGLQSNSDTLTLTVESNVVSIVNESGEKGGVSNEEREVEKQANRVCNQEDTPENELIVTSDSLHGTVCKAYALNKTFPCNDLHIIVDNKGVFDAADGGQVTKSDCSKFQQILDLSIELPCPKDSDSLHASYSVAEEKLTPFSKTVSFSSTENNVAKTPSTVTETDDEPKIRSLEINVISTKQLSSDKTDLENYENELKVCSSDRDFHIPENALDDGVSVKSTDDTFNSSFSENLKPEQTDLVSRSTASDTAPSKMMYGNSIQQADATDEGNTSNQSAETNTCKDMVGRAAAVVEYYVSVMEEDSHAMMSRLLQQGIEFWLSHSLPVDHLENLLLKHMSKFFYPLGLLLFCKDGSAGEEAVETQQQAVSMLNHLSTRFCLQLCSSLLNHIDQRKAYPEYIELLAQVTSLQTAPGLNGCCVTAQGLSQSPEQLMEAILEGLGGTKGLGGSSGQTYINLQEEVSETCKDSSSETTKLEQLLAFSCGHHYGQSVFHQSVLPELELGLLQLHHPLPNTARVLKGLFVSNAPNLHLACPRCVLSYLQSQTTPPL